MDSPHKSSEMRKSFQYDNLVMREANYCNSNLHIKIY